MTEFYRDYKISYDPPPVPTRAWDYQFVHIDYDGPPDERCGTAPSLEDAKRQIDEIIAESEPEPGPEFVVLPEMQDIADTMDDIFKPSDVKPGTVTIRRGRIKKALSVVECVLLSSGGFPSLYYRELNGPWTLHMGSTLTPAMEAALRQVIGVVP